MKLSKVYLGMRLEGRRPRGVGPFCPAQVMTLTAKVHVRAVLGDETVPVRRRRNRVHVRRKKRVSDLVAGCGLLVRLMATDTHDPLAARVLSGGRRSGNGRYQIRAEGTRMTGTTTVHVGAVGGVFQHVRHMRIHLGVAGGFPLVVGKVSDIVVATAAGIPRRLGYIVHGLCRAGDCFQYCRQV